MIASPPPTSALRPTLQAILAGIALALIIFACLPIIASLIGSWNTEEYSHGYLIPVLAVLLGWHRLAEKKPPLIPSWWGIAVLFFAALLIIIGKLSAFEPPSFYGFLLTLVGFSFSVFGTAATRVLAPAFVYLVFAIPLPRLIYVGLSEHLQLLSSTLGVLPLELLGIPVFQEGNVIDLGSLKLQVVDACSGLRYLFPLMSFGYLVAWLMEDRAWKCGVVFLSTIPITIAMNSLRIALIGITVEIWGEKAAGGFLHTFEGWSVFLVCTAVLMGEVSLLQKIGKHGRFRFDYLGFVHGPVFSRSENRVAPVIAALVFSAGLAALLGTRIIDQRSEIVPFHPPFAAFPLIQGDWHGRQHILEPEVLKALQLSDYWLADYWHTDEKAPVDFYLAYYASQRVGSSAHSPANCLPGNGWQILDTETKKVPLNGDKSITVSRMLVRQGDKTELAYYWFDERGRDLTDQYGAKWYLLLDSITLHRTDGALIRLMTPIDSSETEAAADRRLTDFLANIFPEIGKFVPGANGTNSLVGP